MNATFPSILENAENKSVMFGFSCHDYAGQTGAMNQFSTVSHVQMFIVSQNHSSNKHWQTASQNFSSRPVLEAWSYLYDMWT